MTSVILSYAHPIFSDYADSHISKSHKILRISHFYFYSYHQKTEKCWGDWPIMALNEHLISKVDHPAKETQYEYSH